MASTGNNNLDFHLAFYLGVHHLEAGKDVKFHVISNDKGFDGVIQHLVDMGRACERVSRAKKKTAKKVVAKKTVAKKVVAKKAVAKKASAKKTAKKASKQIAAKKAAKKISNSVALKGLNKILVSSVELEQLKDVVVMLNASSEDNRPNKKKTLVNWVANRLEGELSVSLKIVELLLKSKIIKEGENGLKYSFGRESIFSENMVVESEIEESRDYQYNALDILKVIRALDSLQRPRSLPDLEKWIMGQLDTGEFVAKGIYNKLIREGCVQPSEDWIDYDFGAVSNGT